MTTLFCSYSHADLALRNELHKHLAPLQREKLIECWYDGEIEAGTPLDREIRLQLERADIVLLLISADFGGCPGRC